MSNELSLSLDDLDGEVWKDINGYKGFYKVSNWGRIKSLDRIIKSKRYHNNGQHYKERILKQIASSDGYMRVQLYIDSQHFKTFRVHILVAKAFIPNPLNKPQVNHKDGNKNNNRVDNLEWCTNGENGQHAWDNHLRTKRYGKENHASKKVIQYSKDGSVLKVWDCINDIIKTLGYCRTSIIHCCQHKTQYSHDYIWRYYEEVENE